jgi:hypothetical protein
MSSSGLTKEELEWFINLHKRLKVFSTAVYAVFGATLNALVDYWYLQNCKLLAFTWNSDYDGYSAFFKCDRDKYLSIYIHKDEFQKLDKSLQRMLEKRRKDYWNLVNKEGYSYLVWPIVLTDVYEALFGITIYRIVAVYNGDFIELGKIGDSTIYLKHIWHYEERERDFTDFTVSIQGMPPQGLECCGLRFTFNEQELVYPPELNKAKLDILKAIYSKRDIIEQRIEDAMTYAFRGSIIHLLY